MRRREWRRTGKESGRASWLIAVVSQIFFILYQEYPSNHLFLDGNSQKNHLNQPKVLHNICEQLTAPLPPSSSSTIVPAQHSIIGIMIESNIHAGRQDLPDPTPEDMDEANNTIEKGSAVAKKLKYGVSITDACVHWDMTLEMLDEVNEVCFECCYERSISNYTIVLFSRLSKRGGHSSLRRSSLRKWIWTKSTKKNDILELFYGVMTVSKKPNSDSLSNECCGTKHWHSQKPDTDSGLN